MSGTTALSERIGLSVDGYITDANGNAIAEVMYGGRETCHEAVIRFNSNATIITERDRYKRALEEIANQDYRGGRSTESVIAYKALNPKETP